MGWQASHHTRRADIPKEDGLVVGATDDYVALGGEGDGVDVVVVTEESSRMGFALTQCISQDARAERPVDVSRPTVVTSQSLIDLSSEPEARMFESGLHAIVEIPARWPSSVCSCLPIFAFHILIVPSAAVCRFEHQQDRFSACGRRCSPTTTGYPLPIRRELDR